MSALAKYAVAYTIVAVAGLIASAIWLFALPLYPVYLDGMMNRGRSRQITRAVWQAPFRAQINGALWVVRRLG